MTGDLAGNIARVRERIEAAAARAGRDAGEIALIAVTKRQPPDAARAALEAGLTGLGENYVQEAVEKRASVGAGRWHLIGHLQTNKAKIAAATFDVVQSVDSVRLAQALGRHATACGRTLDVLVQVHLGDEETKSGVVLGQAPEIAAQVAAVPGLRLCGLMGVAPLEGDPRPHFVALRRLFDALPLETRKVLSMGMTGDFEIAIEEGATMLRLGTALFGARTP